MPNSTSVTDELGKIIAEYEGGIDSIARTPPREYTKNTISTIHSMTKLVTAIAVLQCVERGLVSLDEDISNYLPEWKNPHVLEGFNGEEPILRPAEGFISLRYGKR
jgi:CubicO group peptidase (beta-lactamase class C family)